MDILLDRKGLPCAIDMTDDSGITRRYKIAKVVKRKIHVSEKLILGNYIVDLADSCDYEILVKSNVGIVTMNLRYDVYDDKWMEIK